MPFIMTPITLFVGALAIAYKIITHTGKDNNDKKE